MKDYSCQFWYARIMLMTLIICSNTEGCYAFPPKPRKQGGMVNRPAKVPFDTRGNKLTFHRRHVTDTDDHTTAVSASKSYSSSESSSSSPIIPSPARFYSPDNNTQLHQQNPSRRRQHPQHSASSSSSSSSSSSLRQSSIPVEFDRSAWEQGKDIIGADPPSRVSTIVDSAWSAVSKKLEVLTPLSARTISQQRRRRLLLNRRRTFARASTAASFVEPPTPTIPPTTTTKKTDTKKTENKLSKMDVAMFVTYFCNIAVVTLSVVTVPAMAIEHNLTPHATAAFCAGVASLAPLGGVVGKLVNGFVCQHLGGQRASWIYLLALSALSLSMSFSRSLAPVGLCLIGFEFLSSIQWTSVCHVLDQNYRTKPQQMAKGIALLSLSSTFGALAAKTVGAGMLQATNWRTVSRLGSLISLLGASAMYLGGGKYQKPVVQKKDDVLGVTGGQQKQSPLSSLNIILKSPVFWMIGIGHSLGYLARGSDRLLGPFLQQAGGISSTMAAGLTSSVTIGFVIGLLQGNVFSKIESVKEKMNMIKKSYVVSVLSTMGLAVCGINGISRFVGGSSNIVAAAITVFAGIIASTVSFQFYQFPNLVSATVFPENTAVALSLTDAVGFFVTASVLGVNKSLLANFGWFTAWTFMAAIFGVGGAVMTQAIQPVLIQSQKNQRRQR